MPKKELSQIAEDLAEQLRYQREQRQITKRPTSPNVVETVKGQPMTNKEYVELAGKLGRAAGRKEAKALNKLIAKHDRDIEHSQREGKFVDAKKIFMPKATALENDLQELSQFNMSKIQAESAELRRLAEENRRRQAFRRREAHHLAKKIAKQGLDNAVNAGHPEAALEAAAELMQQLAQDMPVTPAGQQFLAKIMAACNKTRLTIFGRNKNLDPRATSSDKNHSKGR